MTAVAGMNVGASHVRMAIADERAIRVVVAGNTCPTWRFGAPPSLDVDDDASLRTTRFRWYHDLDAGDPRDVAAPWRRCLVHLLGAALQHLGAQPDLSVVALPRNWLLPGHAPLPVGDGDALHVGRVVGAATAVVEAMVPDGEEGTTLVIDGGHGHTEVSVVEVVHGLIHAVHHSASDALSGERFAQAIGQWLRKGAPEVPDEPWFKQALTARVSEALTCAAPGADLVVRAPSLGAREVPSGLVAAVGRHAASHMERFVLETIAEASLRRDAIDRVLVTGGLCRAPEVRAWIDAWWGSPVTHCDHDVVARGAALYGSELLGLRHAARISDVADVARPPTAPPRPTPLRTPPARLTTPPRALTAAPPRPVSSVPSERSSSPPRPVSTAPPSSHPAPATTSAPPSMPPGVTSVPPPPPTGSFSAVRDLKTLLFPPLACADPRDDAVTVPLLLMRIAWHRELTGRLHLRDAENDEILDIDRAGPVFAPQDRPRLARVFLFGDGTFRWHDRPVHVGPLMVRSPMLSFVGSGMRALLRDADEAAIVAAFGAQLDRVPAVRRDRAKRVELAHLTSVEARGVDFALDHGRPLRVLLDEGFIGRGTLVRAVALLQGLDALEWKDAAAEAGVERVAVLDRELARSKGFNHFEALGVHWTCGREEAEDAWLAMQRRYGPGSPWHAASPERCARLLLRGRMAWDVLSDDARRVAHRRETHPDHDESLLAGVVEARVRALKMKGEHEEAANMLRLLHDLGGEMTPDEAFKKKS